MVRNMALTTVTTKGQVTIPKSIRDMLNIKSGDKLEIVIQNDEAIIRPVSKSINDVFGILNQGTQRKVRVEEMDKAIKRRFKKISK